MIADMCGTDALVHFVSLCVRRFDAKMVDNEDEENEDEEDEDEEQFEAENGKVEKGFSIETVCP